MCFEHTWFGLLFWLIIHIYFGFVRVELEALCLHTFGLFESVLSDLDLVVQIHLGPDAEVISWLFNLNRDALQVFFIVGVLVL